MIGKKFDSVINLIVFLVVIPLAVFGFVYIHRIFSFLVLLAFLLTFFKNDIYNVMVKNEN